MERKMKLKELIEFIICGALLLLVIFITYNAGRMHENERIEKCYMDKDFSGFAWIDGSKYFVCSSEIRKGAVTYKKGK